MSYDSNVLALSPKHFWKLDETSGTVATDYGSTPTNGVYVGSPSLNQAALSAPSGPQPGTASSGPSMNLDAVDDRVTIATNPAYTALTVCGWFKVNTTTDQCWFHFSQSSGSIPIAIGGGPSFGTSSKWNVGVFSGSSWYTLVGLDISNGMETFILATMSSGGVLRLWQNGRLKGSIALPTIPAMTSTNGLYIGRRWDNNVPANGRAAGIALWDSVLTDSQIQSIVPATSYVEQLGHIESLAPNPSPFRAYGEGSGGGGGGGGGAIPTTGQLWPRGNW